MSSNRTAPTPPSSSKPLERLTSITPSITPVPLLILIAGAYTAGTEGDPVKIAANQARLESYCLPIYQRGHLPLVSEWMALPIVQAAGKQLGGSAVGVAGNSVFAQYQTPVAHRLLSRCDVVLRIDGASQGADMDVALARQLGLRVFTQVNDIPDLSLENRQQSK